MAPVRIYQWGMLATNFLASRMSRRFFGLPSTTLRNDCAFRRFREEVLLSQYGFWPSRTGLDRQTKAHWRSPGSRAWLAVTTVEEASMGPRLSNALRSLDRDFVKECTRLDGGARPTIAQEPSDRQNDPQFCARHAEHNGDHVVGNVSCARRGD
jgi:hypothetical protein